MRGDEEESDSPRGDNGGYIAFYICQRVGSGVLIFSIAKGERRFEEGVDDN